MPCNNSSTASEVNVMCAKDCHIPSHLLCFMRYNHVATALAVTRRSIEKNSYKFPTKFLQFCRKWGIAVDKSQNCDKMGH